MLGQLCKKLDFKVSQLREIDYISKLLAYPERSLCIGNTEERNPSQGLINLLARRSALQIIDYVWRYFSIKSFDDIRLIFASKLVQVER